MTSTCIHIGKTITDGMPDDVPRDGTTIRIYGPWIPKEGIRVRWGQWAGWGGLEPVYGWLTDDGSIACFEVTQYEVDAGI